MSLPFPFEPMEAVTYPGVGRCIYCDATGGLSREHIIPFGLGGRAILPAASCAACAVTTGQVEQRLLRSGNWWPLRRALDLASRRAKKQPDSFRAHVTAAGESFVVEIPIKQLPLIVAVLGFDPPGYLGGPAHGGEDQQGEAQRIWGWNLGALQFAHRYEARLVGNVAATQDDLTLQLDFSAMDLMRLLAKIALGWAVAQHGLEMFEKIYVRDLILGRPTSPHQWVGGCRTQPVFATRELHSVTYTREANDVLVYIQLFRPPAGWPEPPVYQVVVGSLAR